MKQDKNLSPVHNFLSLFLLSLMNITPSKLLLLLLCHGNLTRATLPSIVGTAVCHDWLLLQMTKYKKIVTYPFLSNLEQTRVHFYEMESFLTFLHLSTYKQFRKLFLFHCSAVYYYYSKSNVILDLSSYSRETQLY